MHTQFFRRARPNSSRQKDPMEDANIITSTAKFIILLPNSSASNPKFKSLAVSSATGPKAAWTVPLGIHANAIKILCRHVSSTQLVVANVVIVLACKQMANFIKAFILYDESQVLTSKDILRQRIPLNKIAHSTVPKSVLAPIIPNRSGWKKTHKPVKVCCSWS